MKFLYQLEQRKTVEATAKKALSTYIRKLNCIAGAILKEEYNTLSKVISIPKKIERNTSYDLFIQSLKDTSKEHANNELTSWSIHPINDEQFLHQIALPQFGRLILIKKRNLLQIKF